MMASTSIADADETIDGAICACRDQ